KRGSPGRRDRRWGGSASYLRQVPEGYPVLDILGLPLSMSKLHSFKVVFVLYRCYFNVSNRDSASFCSCSLSSNVFIFFPFVVERRAVRYDCTGRYLFDLSFSEY